MCGIAGIIGNQATPEVISKMLQKQKHRGPDFMDYYIEERNVALGHNRLSIIDLSSNANQPFTSDCGNFVLIFNGEIYNYIEIRNELKFKYSFKTQSDTEVLLNAFIEWGENCLEKLNGMFSFAIWNKKEQTFFAARDRFGVKPFYYFFDQNNFYFASEINTIFEADVIKKSNENVWLKFFSEGSYGLPNETFWESINQLPGGHFLIFKNNKLDIKKWYFFENRVQLLFDRSDKNEEDYITQLLLKAINLRFRADVPVGFNLSGGLDSSTLLALIDQQNIDKSAVEAFTFVCNDERYDELQWVKSMLNDRPFHLNICPLSSSEIPKLSQKMALYQMEPYGGIPTLAYSKIFETASQKGIKVLLDGQGSDEAWAGYDYYLNNNQNVIQGVANSPFKTNVLDSDFANQFSKTIYDKPFEDNLLNLQYRDLFYTKIPRALRFNDRVSMLYGTELREPFLDYDLVEYVFSRPTDFKIKGGVQKWMLRKIAEKFLQQDLVLAPKRPLQTPQREWLSDDLKEWVRTEVEKLYKNNWFNKSELENELNSFFNGNNQSSFHIWQWINTAQLLE
ncbi:asparagine synthase (glutamine-hydrolyzing) [Flavobacterium capsici]|uniref:asparagine synthase (glutamine-hydrolyzing) n=1 Tax=Flavobacterium capsici TaxID=3075618 RepID=A0AA96EXF8_9FLAO|nr:MULTISPECIES: asparagine synthase (glutamine-hydrolyzing) [unclassified Flavobacterium]WNM20259.1 asparagine synthase (glutamine-hydrolyzing) [Flavobacterium sp. PMR2A8]WNM21649.1 asparagine synthase (glutamine-hydrolyzing) [Flavobacterium sp. PMTSA4]